MAAAEDAQERRQLINIIIENLRGGPTQGGPITVWVRHGELGNMVSTSITHDIAAGFLKDKSLEFLREVSHLAATERYRVAKTYVAQQPVLSSASWPSSNPTWTNAAGPVPPTPAKSSTTKQKSEPVMALPLGERIKVTTCPCCVGGGELWVLDSLADLLPVREGRYHGQPQIVSGSSTPADTFDSAFLTVDTVSIVPRNLKLKPSATGPLQVRVSCTTCRDAGTITVSYPTDLGGGYKVMACPSCGGVKTSEPEKHNEEEPKKLKPKPRFTFKKAAEKQQPEEKTEADDDDED